MMVGNRHIVSHMALITLIIWNGIKNNYYIRKWLYNEACSILRINE